MPYIRLLASQYHELQFDGSHRKHIHKAIVYVQKTVTENIVHPEGTIFEVHRRWGLHKD